MQLDIVFLVVRPPLIFSKSENFSAGLLTYAEMNDGGTHSYFYVYKVSID